MSIVADDFAGRLIITWPKNSGGGPLAGHGIELTDAETGKPIVSAMDLTVHVRMDDVITAEMTMLCDEDGHALFLGEGRSSLPVRTDNIDEVLTSRFRWLVTEMRTAN